MPRPTHFEGLSSARWGPVHLLIDSTGLKIYRASEWLQKKQGVSARRTWRKLHLTVNAGTGIVVASTLTANDIKDPSRVALLLAPIDAGIGSVTADGAPTYDTVAARAGNISFIKYWERAPPTKWASMRGR